MIAKDPIRKSEQDHIARHELMTSLFRESVAGALEESRRIGVPIPRTADGVTRYELPDGTTVDEDPWHGEKTAPEGWYQ